MSKTLAVSLTGVAGMLAALQAPINSTLGKRIGSLPASAVSFAVGTVILVALAFVFGEGAGRLGQAKGLQWYYFAGGALGAFYVTTLLITVRTLGAGALTACIIAGQLAMSVAIDQLGLLGLDKHAMSAQRFGGLVLLAAGTYLVVRF